MSGAKAGPVTSMLAWAQRALNEPGPPTVQGRRPHVQVTVPIGTLLGLDDAPGELAGYGPIDADTTRRLAADGIWRRLLTDPESGALLDYGRTVYHPPADLREHVIACYPRCTFPGCGRAARRCHLDHIHEWRHGGRTCGQPAPGMPTPPHLQEHRHLARVSRRRRRADLDQPPRPRHPRPAPARAPDPTTRTSSSRPGAVPRHLGSADQRRLRSGAGAGR